MSNVHVLKACVEERTHPCHPVFGPALPRSFYARPTVVVARDLVGRVLVHITPEGDIAGIIVEAEAYGPDDPANHAFRGKTARNRTMFGPPGHAYVYLIYGMYRCVNAVTVAEGVGEGVLIRALEPVAGIPIMQRHRRTENLRLLCSGPGRLCEALGITREMDGTDLTTGPLWIAAGHPPKEEEIIATPRVGIREATERHWRFLLRGNPYVSRGELALSLRSVRKEPGGRTSR